MTAAVITLGFVVALLALLVVGLLRSHAEILRRLHDLGAGLYEEEPASRGTSADASSPSQHDAPRTSGPARVTTDVSEVRTRPGVAEPRPATTGVHDLVGATPRGGTKSVRIAGAPHTTLLAFLTSGCATCAAFWQSFADGEAERLPGRDTRLVIVTKGADTESPAAIAELAPAGCTTLMSSEAFDDYGVPVSPYFILVDGPAGEVIGEGAAGSWPQVRGLLEQAAADAGMQVDGSSQDVESRRRAREGGRQREARADAELLAAGITPGHASLYPTFSDEPDVQVTPEPIGTEPPHPTPRDEAQP